MKKERTFEWLGRDTVLAPYTTLCMNEGAYLKAMAHLKITHPGEWLPKHMMACVHTYECERKLCCVVCMSPDAKGADPVQVACTLVHESVHIFQRLCDSIGEDNPSREFEAYSIERISERLMREFVRQTTQ